MPDDKQKIEVDVRLKDTEAGWIDIFDRFGLRVAPVWFSWVGWVLAIGALHFLQMKSGSVVLGLMIGFSHIFLFVYFIAFFYRIEITGLPFLTKPVPARVASLALSGVMALGSWHLAMSVSEEIGRLQQNEEVPSPLSRQNEITE